MSDRAEQVLGVADALYGAITMPVVTALFPDASAAPLRRLMAGLVGRGALVPAWAGGTGRRVWLTTRAASGRVAGLRKWLADADAVRGALVTKNAGTIQPPVTFLHSQISGLIVAGFGACGRKFDSELHTEGGPRVSDGEAWPAPDWRLLIEAERMVRQSAGRWQNRGGLIEKIIAELGQSDDGTLAQHLVVCPRFGDERDGARADFERELDAAITKKTAGLAGISRDSGWWFLSIDEPESDPVWHPVFAGVAAPRSLLGIAARRSNFADQHAKNAERDRARKMRAAAAKAGLSLPAGVTMLPASASHPGSTPTP